MPRCTACQLAMGSLPGTTSPGMANAWPRAMMRCSPCCLQALVEMPQRLFSTTIKSGSLGPGRGLQTRPGAKSRSAVPAADNGDAVAAVPLLNQRGARRHGILDFNHRADRDHIPFAAGIVAGKIAAHGVRVGACHTHLPDAIDERHAHGYQGSAIA